MRGSRNDCPCLCKWKKKVMSAIASRFGPAIAVAVSAIACRVLTIVLHGLEVETNEIREKKVVLRKVPCSVTDLHGVGLVGGGAGRRHVVQRRHGGGPPTGLPDGVAKRPGIVRSVSNEGFDSRDHVGRERAAMKNWKQRAAMLWCARLANSR